MSGFLSRSRLRAWLIGLSILAALQLALALMAFWQSTNARGEGFALPGPSRIAAIVSVIEPAPPAQRSQILRAMSSARFEAEILTVDPAFDRSADARMMTGTASVIEAQLPDEYSAGVEAWFDEKDGTIRRTPFELWSDAPLYVAISLRTGDWLLLKARGNHADFIFGLPSGFWAGLFGVTVAFAALALLWWSLRPLEKIEQAMARFADEPVAVPVTPSGPREARRIVAAVNRMQHDLAELFQERQVMFGALSHDLRTLLTRLRLRVDLIDDPDWRDRADADLAAMNDVIENGLALARLDASSKTGGERVEIGEFVQELVSSAEITADKVTVTDAARGATLCCDPHTLLRGLRNLVDNAHLYGGGCSINIERSAKRLTIDVIDHGPGIKLAELEMVLRPFHRGSEGSRESVGGSGLGLAIAKRAAEQAGGNLTLRNRREGGLIAQMQLPVVDAVS